MKNPARTQALNPTALTNQTRSITTQSELRVKRTSLWVAAGERYALELFHRSAARVPAYQRFLKLHNIHPKNVRTLQDFLKLPPVTKENYIRAYPGRERLWDGDIGRHLTVYATSGTTGEPSYFYRDLRSDFNRKLIIDTFLQQNKRSTSVRTLFIVTFGMGVWSAGIGVYTGAYLSSKLNNYPISIISPGVDQEEVLKILKNIAPNFDQVILGGYPPFVKDVIDEAVRQRIPIKKYRMRFIFTGEAFTEEYRDYISKKSGVQNPLLDTMNNYGTSELGSVAFETPLSILVRKIAREKRIEKDLFGETGKATTLAQYIPSTTYIDTEDGELYFTGDASMPFVRYDSGDRGGLLTYEQIQKIFSDGGIDLERKSKEEGIQPYISKLPFVYVYERRNLAVTLYGILIYPEYFKPIFFEKSLTRFLTGKFTLMQKYDARHNQYLELHLELKPRVRFKKEYERITLERVVAGLKLRSSEFRELTGTLGSSVYPHLVFWPYGHQTYFGSPGKQQWVKK